MEWVERNTEEPWVIVDLTEGEEAAKRILSRSISTKYCIQGISVDTCLEDPLQVRVFAPILKNLEIYRVGHTIFGIGTWIL